MHAADLVGAVEVGERARHPQHAMIAARGEPHGVGGVAQQRKPAGVRPRHVFRAPGPAPPHWCARAAGRSRHSARPAWHGRARRAAATSRLPSVGGGRMRSAAVTAGTSMCRSMRSISGPGQPALVVGGAARVRPALAGEARLRRARPQRQGFIAATSMKRAG